MAAAVAGALGGEYWAGRPTDVEPHAYDIASMVIGALAVEKDRQSTYALNEIGAAASILADMSDDDDVLEGAMERHEGRVQAAQPSGPDSQIAELAERLELVSEAAIELKCWAATVAPGAMEAIRETGAGGSKSDAVDYFNVAASIFKRIDDLAEIIFFAQDAKELTIEELRECAQCKKSVAEVHYMRGLRRHMKEAGQ